MTIIDVLLRIQLRLPDGSSHTHHFPAEAPLSDLYAFVRTDTNYTSFSLSTTFPRRNLDTEDQTSSLKDLQMAPSCTVMVLPTTVSARDGDFMSLVWLLLTPFTVLWGIVSSFFGSSVSQGVAQGSATNTGSGSRVTRQGGIGRLRNSDFSDDENNTWNGNSTQQK